MHIESLCGCVIGYLSGESIPNDIQLCMKHLMDYMITGNALIQTGNKQLRVSATSHGNLFDISPFSNKIRATLTVEENSRS